MQSMTLDIILLNFIGQILLIVLFAIGVGTLSSMLGIGGGIFNTPLLIIVFGLSAQSAAASSLVAALFVAGASSIAYFCQRPSPIIIRSGLLLAVMAIPGSLTGVLIRTLITNDYILRLIFGFLLFPIAIKIIFSQLRGTQSTPLEPSIIDLAQIPKARLAYSLGASFFGGIVAGILGLGGGVIFVPVLTLLLQTPIHAAVATSMFIIIFSASAGTVLNYVGGYINLFFVLALGTGMVIGGLIGPRFVRKIKATQLKQLFGLILLLPIIRMMRLGQLWLDPVGTNFILALIGDLIIWLLLLLIIGLIIGYKKQTTSKPLEQESS